MAEFGSLHKLKVQRVGYCNDHVQAAESHFSCMRSKAEWEVQ